MTPLGRADIPAQEQRPPHLLVYPPLIHRMLHVFVQKHATQYCRFLADYKKSFFNFPRKITIHPFVLRFYDPKHATTPVIRRDVLRPPGRCQRAWFTQQVGRGVLARLPPSGLRHPTWIASQTHPASRHLNVEHVSDVLLSCVDRNAPVSRPLTHGETIMTNSAAISSQTPTQASQPHNVRKCPVLSGPTDLPGEIDASPDSQTTCAQTPPSPDRTWPRHHPAQPHKSKPSPPTPSMNPPGTNPFVADRDRGTDAAFARNHRYTPVGPGQAHLPRSPAASGGFFGNPEGGFGRFATCRLVANLFRPMPWPCPASFGAYIRRILRSVWRIYC